VVILCGGLGTRLKTLMPHRPKALAEIQGKPFLDIILEKLKREGFHDVILSIGYLGDQIRTHLQKKGDNRVVFSEEERPLGTGGALKRALSFVTTNTVLVLNGDTLFTFHLRDLLDFHRAKGAIFSMALTKQIREDGGGVHLDTHGTISSFSEKSKPAPFINAGVYAVEKKIMNFMPSAETFSLEHDFFPSLVRQERCFGFPTKSEIIDIGTPERYQEAQRYAQEL